MGNFKVTISMQRLIPFFQYHHILMIILTSAIILISILLAGCSSYATMTAIYPLRISYRNPSGVDELSSITRNLSATLASFKGNAAMEVRLGYFGMCVRQQSQVVWVCWKDAQGIRDQIGAQNDPLGLLNIADTFKNEVLFSGLLFMAVVLAFLTVILLFTFPGWHEEIDATTGEEMDVKPFPSRPISVAAAAFNVVAAMLTLVSALWQHVGAVAAAAMLDKTGYGSIETHIGPSAIVLGWISFIALTFTSIGLVVMILSIFIMDKLTDD